MNLLSWWLGVYPEMARRIELKRIGFLKVASWLQHYRKLSKPLALLQNSIAISGYDIGAKTVI